MKIFKPLEEIKGSEKSTIQFGWLIALLSFWVVCSFSKTHMFPTIKQVLIGFVQLWNDGLIVHLGSSLSLCFQAMFYSVIISLIFAYSTTIPAFKSLGTFISKLRYLPLAGITFYITILFNDARTIQVGVLVLFMTTFARRSPMEYVQWLAQRA